MLSKRLRYVLLPILLIAAVIGASQGSALTPTPAPTATPMATLPPTYTPSPLTRSETPVAIPNRELIVRSGPGLDYDVIGTVEANQPVPIYAISDDGSWALISPLGSEGKWLGLSPFVKLTGDLSSVGVWGATRVPPPPSPTPLPQPTLDMDVLVGTVQAAVVKTLVAQAQTTAVAQATQVAAQQATAIALQNMPVDVSQDDDPAIGPEDAPVVIIEFSDFSCPYCGRFARDTLPQLLEQYKDQIRFVYRDAPILGPNSLQAALAAECADDQGQFWPYHNLLFNNQQNLTRDGFITFAQDLELDMDTFTSCLDNQTHRDEITKDLQDAQAAGLTGTPTFFINGRRLIGAQPMDAFVKVIDEELAKNK